MEGRRRRTNLCAVIALLMVTPLAGGVAEMAKSKQWQSVLRWAVLRADQVPLRSEEALVVAHAARNVGEATIEGRYLERACSDAVLGPVATVELGQLLAHTEPSRALATVMPLLHDPPNRELRNGAVAVASAAVIAGVDGDELTALERAVARLPRGSRRQLEVALAARDGDGGHERLAHILERSTSDLVSLDAALALGALPGCSSEHRWLVAKTLYAHAMYDQAEPILEALLANPDTEAPRWELAFVRGRCAFRRGRWDEAAQWYHVALHAATQRERQADLEVHIARCNELEGRLEEAIAGAERAVGLRPTDERRLFLTRLRLRNDQPDLAVRGVVDLRGRHAGERGQLLVALDEIRRGRTEQAAARLRTIRRTPWAGPAMVVCADLAARDHDPRQATDLLLEAAREGLDAYWGMQARNVVLALTEDARRGLLEDAGVTLENSIGSQRRRALAVIGQLTIGDLRPLQEETSRLIGFQEPTDPPPFPSALAGKLWSLGLSQAMVRWDPRGLPRKDCSEVVWSAHRLLEADAPDAAVRMADAAWRMAGDDLPMRIMPMSLQRAFVPLPYEKTVRRVAADAKIPWSLVAGVAREESRWDAHELSAVGARGLLQLMPSTAKAVAGSLDLELSNPDLLFDPALSLSLGATELGRLLTRYRGHRAAAVAAYNAGEAQADLWLEQCGTPCTEARYILNISFGATRSYTADVLASAGFYEELFPQTPKDPR